MGILSIILIFVVIGLILYLINTFIPMEARVKQLMNTAVVIFLVLLMIVWLLQVAGLHTGLGSIHL